MNNEFAADLITLIDDQGEEHEFEILDVIENTKGCFYALFPIPKTSEELVQSEGIYYIFEEVEEDGEKQLAEVEDEKLLDELSEEFEKRFDEMYEDDEDFES